MNDAEELGDAKFEERRYERLKEHYNNIIAVGYHVTVPHGEGKVVGYEILHPRKVFTTTTKPKPGIGYRYMIELSPGHTWSADQPFYFAFPNEVHMQLGQL